MKKANFKAILAMLLVGVMGVSMTACSGNGDTASSGESSSAENSSAASASEELPEPVELNIASFRVGTHNAAAAETRYVTEFQELYNGVDKQKITINIEEMPSDQEYYNQMLVRASSNTLPDVFEGNNGVLELAVQNGIAVDMNPYVEADPEYAKELGEDALEFGRNWEDGGLYNISYGRQSIGYFYNKEMFEEAGITPATTWDEWMSNLETLKTSGVCSAPLSSMTGENCWTTNLILSSIIGTSGEEGNEFMNINGYIQDYDESFVAEAYDMIRTMLKDYSLPDAIGSDYATTANHFLNEETAIIANGPWMTPDFSNTEKAAEGFADKVDIALFPENGTISQFERGYSIAKSDKATEDAAWEFIKFKTGTYGQQIHLEEAGTLPMNPETPVPEEYKEAEPLVAKLIEMGNDVEWRYKSIDAISYTTANNAMNTLFPQLVDGTITAEEMCKQLTEAAKSDANYGK